MKWFVVAAVPTATASPALADKASNRAYVQSGPDDVLNARCVQDALTGSAGRTRCYCVGKERNDLLDTYDWYAPDGVTLGWSPTTGKVAVMARGVELSFYLGGNKPASYATSDLGKLGVEVTKRRATAGPELLAEFRVAA